MIPNNIAKEHIFKAIVEIKQKGIPPHRVAARFFLDYDGENFPPKYVLSIANKYANGSELNPRTFSGGIETNGFLEKLGFKINEESSTLKTNVWVEKTYLKDRPHKVEGDLALGKALISPQRDKRHADIYRNMRIVRNGDIILHLVDNEEIVGISKVKKDVSENRDFVYSHAFTGGDPEDKEPGYKVVLDGFIKFSAPVDKSDVLNESNRDILQSIAEEEGNVFYDKGLSLRQGAYLTAVPKRLLEIINKAYRAKNGGDLPYILETTITNNPSNQSQSNQLLELLKSKKQIILYGPPGTGKTFQATRVAISFLEQKGSS